MKLHRCDKWEECSDSFYVKTGDNFCWHSVDHYPEHFCDTEDNCTKNKCEFAEGICKPRE